VQIDMRKHLMNQLPDKAVQGIIDLVIGRTALRVARDVWNRKTPKVIDYHLNPHELSILSVARACTRCNGGMTPKPDSISDCPVFNNIMSSELHGENYFLNQETEN
jgi:hypothetical protein